MIKVGSITHRQDIKTDGPMRQPAPTWLMLFVVVFYLALLAACFRVGLEMAPVLGDALSAGDYDAKTGALADKNKGLQVQLDKFKKMRTYVDHKEAWAKASLGAGDFMRKIFLALPPDVKLRSMSYEYKPGASGVGLVKLKLMVKGTYEAAKISAAIEKVDSRLGVSSRSQNLTEQGTEVEMEYQIK